ncbi:MAG: C40 family peptidase [Candidatus Nanopelagicaceae bacterium]|jgi:cell wall-associated NlpC family hydrolase
MRQISKKLFTGLAASGLAMTLIPAASAAPTAAQVQKQVNELRDEAASKYEAANGVNFQISKLQRELNGLKAGEAAANAKTLSLKKEISKMAVENYKNGGLGNGLELLLSRDPSKYLSDAAMLDVLAQRYSTKLRQLQSYKQGLQSSQLVVADRQAQLKAAQKRLQAQVAAANAALKKAEKLLASLKIEERKKLEAADDAEQKKILAESKRLAALYAGGSSKGAIALKYALNQLGDIYVWAGAGPTKWDCSGLTMRAFQAAGVSMPHFAAAQFRYGKSVPYSAIAPGDLLFFGRPISHVGIYLGKGKMVHAPRPGKKVEIAPSNRLGYKVFVGAKRL